MSLASLRSRLSAATALTVSVLAGTADLAVAQTGEPPTTETLGSGATRTVIPPDRRAAARAIDLWAAVRVELPPPTDERGELARKEQHEQHQELCALVLRFRSASLAIGPALRTDLGGGTLGAEARARAVQVALLGGDTPTFRAAATAWHASPDGFSLDAAVAAAQAGFVPARARLAESLRDAKGDTGMWLAATLALTGDAAVRVRLGRPAAIPMDRAIADTRLFDARCQAAVALASLGDDQPLQTLRSDVHRFVAGELAAKDPQRTERAAWFVRRVLYYLAEPQPKLSWLQQRVDALQVPEFAAGVDAASVRAAADRMLPVGK